MNYEEKIGKGLLCRYCGRQTELTGSAEMYNGVSYGMMYICRACNAYVGCHKGTTQAYGSVADSELRELRHMAHGWFDPIWQKKIKRSRYNAYSWLSLRLGLNKNITHMGMFDKEDCRRVIELCKNYIKERNPALYLEIERSNTPGRLRENESRHAD